MNLPAVALTAAAGLAAPHVAAVLWLSVPWVLLWMALEACILVGVYTTLGTLPFRFVGVLLLRGARRVAAVSRLWFTEAAQRLLRQKPRVAPTGPLVPQVPPRALPRRRPRAEAQAQARAQQTR